MNSNKTQIIITGRAILAEGRVRSGQLMWVSVERAAALIRNGIAAFPKQAAGPKETPTAGPTETKKPYSDAPVGPSTRSAKLIEPHGSDAPPSVSGADSLLQAQRVKGPSLASRMRGGLRRDKSE